MYYTSIPDLFLRSFYISVNKHRIPTPLSILHIVMFQYNSISNERVISFYVIWTLRSKALRYIIIHV